MRASVRAAPRPARGCGGLREGTPEHPGAVTSPPLSRGKPAAFPVQYRHPHSTRAPPLVSSLSLLHILTCELHFWKCAVLENFGVCSKVVRCKG